MNRARLLAWTAAVVGTVVAALLMPFRLTDGDSCLYAAMAHDMAAGGSWLAPSWDFHGAPACFHEHPPGALWLSAVAEELGAPRGNAALVANAVWTLLAVGGVIAIARRFVSETAADAAGLVFLLHVGVLHYVQRAGLELPLAATAAWTVAAGLRLGRAWHWTPVAAAALTGAVLTRGVLGLVPAALLLALLADPRLRPPWLRLAIVFAASFAALLAFDRAHAASHGFWIEYWRRQVAPSLAEGGTSHSVQGGTWLYYTGRFAAYASPWLLLPVGSLLRRRPRVAPEAWRLMAIWVVLVVGGASLTSREGSRYLFQAWVATSVLFALALPRELRGPSAWAVSTFVLLVLPAQILVKSAFPGRDDWWRTAGILAEARRDRIQSGGGFVAGAFQPEDDRTKSVLRFHLDAWVSSAPVTQMRGLQWVPGADADFPIGKVLVATPLGALIDYGR